MASTWGNSWGTSWLNSWGAAGGGGGATADNWLVRFRRRRR